MLVLYKLKKKRCLLFHRHFLFRCVKSCTHIIHVIQFSLSIKASTYQLQVDSISYSYIKDVSVVSYNLNFATEQNSNQCKSYKSIHATTVLCTSDGSMQWKSTSCGCRKPTFYIVVTQVMFENKGRRYLEKVLNCKLSPAVGSLNLI